MILGEKIDSLGAFLLMISTVLPTAVLSVPAVVAASAKQDAWLSTLVAVALGCAVAAVVAALGARFPGKTIVQWAEVVLGRVPGKIVGILYLWWLLHTNGLIIDEFASFLCAAIMPDTPFQVFFLAGIAVAGYAVRSGLEVLCRFNELFLPGLAAVLMSVFALTVKDMKLARILPLLEDGFIPVLKGAAVPAAWLGEIVIFSVFIPSLRRTRDAPLIAFSSVVGNGLFLTLSTLVSLLTFGPNVAGRWTFPVYSAVQAVSVATVLERLESVTVAVWVFGGFAKIAVFYYAAAVLSGQVFGLRDYRPLVAPIGVVLLGMAQLCQNIIELGDFIASGWPPYALLVFEGGIPLLLLCTAVITGKRGDGR